jgi:hypothetical protein
VYAGLVGPFRVTDPAAYGSTYASGQRLDGECLVLWSNASPAGTFLPQQSEIYNSSISMDFEKKLTTVLI